MDAAVQSFEPDSKTRRTFGFFPDRTERKYELHLSQLVVQLYTIILFVCLYFGKEVKKLAVLRK